MGPPPDDPYNGPRRPPKPKRPPPRVPDTRAKRAARRGLDKLKQDIKEPADG
jgi:hypothetical protein